MWRLDLSATKAMTRRLEGFQVSLKFTVNCVPALSAFLNAFIFCRERTTSACCSVWPEFSPAFTLVCKAFSVTATQSSTDETFMAGGRFLTWTLNVALDLFGADDGSGGGLAFRG